MLYERDKLFKDVTVSEDFSTMYRESMSLAGIDNTKSLLKIGENLIIRSDKKFSWFHKKMWKLFFGIVIEDYKR